MSLHRAHGADGRSSRDPDTAVFDPASLAGLPEPAARFLTRALPPGVPLDLQIELEATGSIELGDAWWPFRSTQLLSAGDGFTWKASVRRGPVFVSGADRYTDGTARMDFRLFGLIPVATASGPDTDRSAAGRLAAETVAWLPQAATPQAGARWTPVDDERAVVTLATPTEPVQVEVVIDGEGRLRSTRTERWRDDRSPPRAEPFGGPIASELTTEAGVRIAGAGSVGWGCGTAEWSEFFRFRLRSARPARSTS